MNNDIRAAMMGDHEAAERLTAAGVLIPRELYSANGFPLDYIIDRDYKGNSYGKSKQVARCGNAVPPPFAAALVRANLPEWCGAEIRTMEELEKVVAV